MWWYENYGIPSALTYGDTSGLFYWFFIYGFLFKHIEKSQMNITNTTPRMQEDTETLARRYGIQTEDTLHILPPGFFKNAFQACIFVREGNWGTEWNNSTMPSSRGSNRDFLSQFSMWASGASMPWFHMWNSKSLIERLCFPWSGIKWNKLDTQVGLLV